MFSLRIRANFIGTPFKLNFTTKTYTGRLELFLCEQRSVEIEQCKTMKSYFTDAQNIVLVACCIVAHDSIHCVQTHAHTLTHFNTHVVKI